MIPGVADSLPTPEAMPERVPSPELAGELQEHVKRELAPYKYPRAVEFVERLPRTETGKIQRYVLRADKGAA